MTNMTIKDRIRLFLATILGRKTILFSRKIEWEKNIKNKLKDKFIVFFYDFNQVKLRNFDTIIPLTLSSQKYLNENKISSLPVLVPSNQCIALCNDKLSFNNYLSKNHLSEYLPPPYIENTYPYILKKRVGAWGIDTFIIQSPKDEITYKEKINSPNYFKQQLIPGKSEYTAHIIAKNGTIVFFKVLRFTYTEQHYIKGKTHKPSSITEVNHDLLLNIFETILSSIDYQGICCFNYKIIDNKPIIFEINPRYGGTMTRVIDRGISSYTAAISSSRS